MQGWAEGVGLRPVPKFGQPAGWAAWGLGVARAHLLRISGAGCHALGNFEEGVGH